jgi:hypothetical protein
MAKQKVEIVIPAGQLWPLTPFGTQMQIEVFGATGEFSTGKTILGLSIAPGAHPAGHAFAGKPRTLYLDLEKSGTSYGGAGCQRIDVPAVLTQAYGAGYTAKQAAEWFNAIPSKVQPGQYDVCVVDPINDIESGQVDLVKSNPTAYGYTKGQIDNSTPLLMAAMKAHYKKLLMGFAGVFKCLYFTTHLRDEFKGGKPTGRRESRGKETLAELASLYLWLERLPDEKGNTSAVPSAIVLKHRLSDTRVAETGQLEVVELMPRRIPVATVQAIRQYIADPPNIEKPAAGEKVIEKPVTEVELQLLRLHTAEAEAAAAGARANLLDRQRELAALRQLPPAVQPAGQPAVQAHVQPAAAAKPAQHQSPAPTPATTPQPTAAGITPQQISEMGSLIKELFTARVEATEWLTTNCGNGDPQTYTETEAMGVLSALYKLKADRQMAAVVPPIAVDDRVQRFKELLPASGIDAAKLKAAMAQHGAERFTELSEQHQDALLAVLQKAADAKAATENEPPFDPGPTSGHR